MNILHISAGETLLLLIVFVAAVTDIRSRTIPNWLTLSGICAGFVLNGASAGWPGIGISAAGMLVGFGAYFLLYCLRAMGAGDVKLMAAVGAVAGPGGWFVVFIASALAGGVFALLLILWKRRFLETLRNVYFIVLELTQLRAPFERHQHLSVKDPRALNMPHGVAIAAGTLACLFVAAI